MHVTTAIVVLEQAKNMVEAKAFFFGIRAAITHERKRSTRNRLKQYYFHAYINFKAVPKLCTHVLNFKSIIRELLRIF